MTPQLLTPTNRHQDRLSLAALTRQLISRNPDEPSDNLSQQKMMSMLSIGRSVDLKFEPSSLLVDFLELCSFESSELDRVVKHGFLKEGSPDALLALVINAERSASRPCFSAY